MNQLELYYFSGSGNSFYVAKNIADNNQGKLISIPSIINQNKIETNAEAIGIIFPVHYIWNGGIPTIINRFIIKLQNISNKYIFAICTCGAVQGDTLIKLNDLIIKKGGKLSIGYSIKFHYNYIDFFGSLAKFTKKKEESLLNNSKQKLIIINQSIKEKKVGIIERDSELFLSIVDSFNFRIKLGKPHYQKNAGFIEHNNIPFSEILPLMDKSFFSDDKCNGCGICSKICPVKNIKIEDKKPLWEHHCEQCFACLQWCPKNSIQYGKKTTNGIRYHHPEVKVTDLIL